MANSDRIQGLRVSQAEIDQMIAAATVIRDCGSQLAAGDSDLVGEITAGNRTICSWRHYPDGEVYDPTSHAPYFFHTHAQDSRQVSERGHFHTFLRAEGMPSGVAPLLLPELAVANAAALAPQAAPLKHGTRDEVSHLIAIAIDAGGAPLRLFTTNRWVTGETWYRAEDVIKMLDHFVIAESGPSAVLNRWIGAVVHLFRPQIAALLRARDDTVMAWRRRRRTQVFEDPRLEITSSLDIALDTQLALVDGVRDRSGKNAFRPAPSLPPMAEGWEESFAG